VLAEKHKLVCLFAGDMSDDMESRDEDSFKESLMTYFNTTEIALVIGSLVVILGSFLNWIENPLAAATGIGTDLGYITIIFSIFVILVAYKNKHPQKRMVLSFLLGLGLLAIALSVVVIIFTETQVRFGGGLYLTIIGATIITIYSLKQYSKYTSKRRATILATGILLLAILVPSTLIVGGGLLDQYQKIQAEQDLEDIEVEQVGTYYSDDSRQYPTADVVLNNPTDREITVSIRYVIIAPHVDLKEVTVPAQSSSTVTLQVAHRPTGSPLGSENASECEENRVEIPDGFFYTYDCDSGPGSLSITADYDYGEYTSH